MLNKKDPLIDAIQQVMQSNQADRDAVKAVNEKFGIQDRRVLPHERQGEWDAAYKAVLTEGVEALDEISANLVARAAKKAERKAGAAADDNLHIQAKAYGDQAERLWDKAEEKREKERRKKDIAGLSSGKKRAYQKRYGKLKEESLDEKLVGNQHKIDANENDRVDGGDFPLLKKGVRPMTEAEKMKGDDPCWKDYEMIGMKKGKGGKPVPNCVPVSEEGDPSKAIRGDVVTGGSSVTTVPKPKTQAPAEPKPVGQADQSKLKNMIMNIKEAKKAAMCEGGMEKTMGEFKRGKLHSGSKTGPIVKSRDQAIAIGMNNEETVSENFPKFSFGGMPRQDAAGRARKDRSDMPGTGPGQGSGAPQSRTADGKSSLPSGTTSTNNNAPPAVGGARPSVVAKNSYSGAQKSTGYQVGGARPSVVAKNSPSQKPYQSGAGAMTNPTQRPYDAKTSPTAKAPATTGSKVVKPVRKQPTTGTAKPTSGGVPVRPARNSSVLNRVAANRKRDKNNDVGP